MPNLTAYIFLETAYINENVGIISFKEDALKSDSSSPVALEKSAGNAAYLTENVDLRHCHSESKLNQKPCTAVCRKIVPSISEVYLHKKSNAQSIQLVTSDQNLVKNCQAPVAQSMAEVVPAQPFVF